MSSDENRVRFDRTEWFKFGVVLVAVAVAGWQGAEYLGSKNDSILDKVVEIQTKQVEIDTQQQTIIKRIDRIEAKFDRYVEGGKG